MAPPLPRGEGRLNDLMAQYRRNAVARGLAFQLSAEEFRELVSSDCFYCGAPPRPLPLYPSRKNNGTASANGIDRLDSSAGYVSGNCRPCCSLCNSMKSDRGAHDYIAHAIRVAARFARLYKEQPHAFQ